MLLLKDGEPVFSDDNGYSHLSQEAHWFMGGLLKHIHSPVSYTHLDVYKRQAKARPSR